MTKPGKIYKDPDAWLGKYVLTVIIVGGILSLGFLGLLTWGLVELIQLLGRLG